MRTLTIILLGLAFAFGALRRAPKQNRSWFQNLKGWHKLLGLVAIALATIILLNPEFLALGLLGDSALFDMLALALSLQMLVSIRWAWHHLSQNFVRTIRWLGIPSPGFRFLMALATVLVANAASSLQKIAHRIFS
jgi:uncharacterized membrane protein YkgB